MDALNGELPVTCEKIRALGHRLGAYCRVDCDAKGYKTPGPWTYAVFDAEERVVCVLSREQYTALHNQMRKMHAHREGCESVNAPEYCGCRYWCTSSPEETEKLLSPG